MSIDVKKKKAAQLIGAINKKYNKQVVAKVSDIQEELTVKFVPTKSLKLNKAMGGGVAKGRIAEFFGPSGSGR